MTDFGLAVQKAGGIDSMFQSACGTPIYIAKFSASFFLRAKRAKSCSVPCRP